MAHSAEQAHEKYRRVIAFTEGLPPLPTAVVHPCDAVSIESAVEAAKLHLIDPILVGPSHKIRAAAEKAGL